MNMPPLDAYEVLGVDPAADQAEIRAAFRRLLHERHPDTAAPGEKPVEDVIEAYRLIGDPARRARYDAGRRARPPGQGRRIPVRRVDRSPASTSSPRPHRCGACGGAGRLRSTSMCPTCGGAGEITELGMQRARRLACRDCRGQGVLTVVTQCERCGGTGAVAS